MPDGEHEAVSSGPFSNGVYDTLKFAALVLLPAVAALYFGVAQIWGLPKAEEVVGTITVFDTFLGVVLGITKAQYDNSDAKFDGEMLVGENKNALVLNDSVENLEGKKELVFKVSRD